LVRDSFRGHCAPQQNGFYGREPSCQQIFVQSSKLFDAPQNKIAIRKTKPGQNPQKCAIYHRSTL